MAMATRQIALLLSLLAVAHGAVGTTPIINSTCAAVSDKHGTHTEYDYCVAALSADPAALAATDSRGLAAAAANLTVANITDTRHVISDLILNLERCLRDYGEMDDIAARARDEISAGLFTEASKKLVQLLDDDIPSWCTLILVQGYAERNPIDQENHNAYLVTALESDITELLLPSHASPPQASG